MHFVNTSVPTSSHQTLLPWTILCVSAEHSIADFFRSDVHSRIGDIECELVSAQIGQERTTLDNVDLSLPLIAVTTSFGWYLKVLC